MLKFLSSVQAKQVSAVDLRKNISDLLDTASRGIAVVVTSNNKEKAVLLSPQQAEAFFADNEQVVTDSPSDYTPLNEDSLTEAAELAGVDSEDDTETETTFDPHDGEGEKVNESDLPDCNACLGNTQFHETLTKQHPHEEDIPVGAKVYDENRQPLNQDDATSHNHVQPERPTMDQPARVEYETRVVEDTNEDLPSQEVPESTTEMIEPEIPVIEEDSTDKETPEQDAGDVLSNQNDTTGFCEAVKAVPTIECQEPAVKRISWRGQEMNMCQFHIDQLDDHNQAYEVIWSAK